MLGARLGSTSKSLSGIPIEVYKMTLQDKESEVRCNAILELKRMKDPNTTDIIVDTVLARAGSYIPQQFVRLRVIRDQTFGLFRATANSR